MRITRVDAIPLWAPFAEIFEGPDKVPDNISHPAFGMRSTPHDGDGLGIALNESVVARDSMATPEIVTVAP